MRLPVAPATATARLWLAAVASAAVIGGAYLLESHGRTWAAAGLGAARGGVPRGGATVRGGGPAGGRDQRLERHAIRPGARARRGHTGPRPRPGHHRSEAHGAPAPAGREAQRHGAARERRGAR